MEISGDKISKLFIELGITVIFLKETESQNYKLYHFKVCKISDFKNIEKQIPIISAFMQKNMTYTKSTIGHFAIMIQKEQEKIKNINLLDNNIYFKNSFDLFIGLDLENKPITINLSDIPHLLIAGTTGSGKSVVINSLISQLLINTKYNCIFYMIDTKKVELAKYKKLKSTFCQVATEYIGAIRLLENICNLIDYRYEILEKEDRVSISKEESRYVVVIEELNDLMMVSKKVVEPYIVKIAQLGRACGVHLIIATQRPVVETLTGSIKANIDCRLALKTTSSIDSRNIIGHSGAEKLVGKGDALIKIPTLDEEIHLQTPFVEQEIINNIIKNFNAGDYYEKNNNKKSKN